MSGGGTSDLAPRLLCIYHLRKNVIFHGYSRRSSAQLKEVHHTLPEGFSLHTAVKTEFEGISTSPTQVLVSQAGRDSQVCIYVCVVANADICVSTQQAVARGGIPDSSASRVSAACMGLRFGLTDWLPPTRTAPPE